MNNDGNDRPNIYAGGNVVNAEKGSIAAGRDIRGRDISAQSTEYRRIELDDQYLSQMHELYANNLRQFIEQINRQLESEKIPSEKIKPIQENMDDLAKNMAGVKPDEQIEDPEKEDAANGAFKSAIRQLIDLSPQIAETVSSCIPILSPFSKVIGRKVDDLIKWYRNRKEERKLE